MDTLLRQVFMDFLLHPASGDDGRVLYTWSWSKVLMDVAVPAPRHTPSQ